MRVEMKDGPLDGEVYPNVRSGANWLRVPGWKVPIYYDASKDKYIAMWRERKKA